MGIGQVQFALLPGNRPIEFLIPFPLRVTSDRYDALEYDDLQLSQFDDLWGEEWEVQVAILVEIDLQMKRPIFPQILELGLFSEVRNLLKCAEVEVVFHRERTKKVTIGVQLQDGPQLGYLLALAGCLRTFEVRVVEGGLKLMSAAIQ